MRRRHAPSSVNTSRTVKANKDSFESEFSITTVNRNNEDTLLTYGSTANVPDSGREDVFRTRVIIRDSFLPLLSVPKSSPFFLNEKLFQPFKSPVVRRTKHCDILLRKKRLGCVPGRALGSNSLFSSKFVVPWKNGSTTLSATSDGDDSEISKISTPPYDPLVVWKRNEDLMPSISENIKPNDLVEQIVIPECIGRFLRPHQREGVKFLFDSVMNLNAERNKKGFGCILADDMGLGKTLQSITLLYTLLKVSMFREDTPNGAKSIAKKCIVVCPTSLVKNWENEINKWLPNKLEIYAVAESTKKEVVKVIKRFVNGLSAQVLILSYDTFRLHKKLILAQSPSRMMRQPENSSICDLLICDEAHKLKNGDSLVTKALDSLPCARRVLLSGTPLQNDLEEFFAMVNFCNPGIVGSLSEFRKKFINPITIGRDPDATESQVKRSELLTTQLSEIVNKFILRRTNNLNVKYLPPKLTQVVCVRLNAFQKTLYEKVISNKKLKQQIKEKEQELDGLNKSKRGVGGGHLALNSINILKKICNHGQLVLKLPNEHVSLGSKRPRTSSEADVATSGFDKSNQDTFDLQSVAEEMNLNIDLKKCNLELSNKFQLVVCMLAAIKKQRLDDKLIVVSNYTQTLELLSVMCKENRLNFVRLDGSVSAKNRNKMVQQLNQKNSSIQVFLLSSKAGGCGLNLIGANRLILFDPDWNPATDKQAAARVWREGQTKNTFVYRFLATGTIEEKIFQRQISKNGLQSVVAAEVEMESSFALKDLKDIFTLNTETFSDTHDKYFCKRCDTTPISLLNQKENVDSSNSPAKSLKASVFTTPRKAEVIKPKPNCPQIGFPTDDELDLWNHYFTAENVEDTVLKEAATMMEEGSVSFVFSQFIDGAQMTEEDLKPKVRKDAKIHKTTSEPPDSDESTAISSDELDKEEQSNSMIDIEISSQQEISDETEDENVLTEINLVSDEEM